MKPPDFEYVRPSTVPEAVAALASSPDDAKVLAGGQSLVPMMNFRLAAPALLVDINRISDLAFVEARDGGVAIGAVARQADVEASALVLQDCPLLAEGLGHVGHPQLRTRGTVVGSLVHADPAAETPAVALALGARVTVSGPRGLRTIAAVDFFQTYFTTDVAPDEIATEVWFPAAPEGSGSAFVEIARRPGDFSMVGVAATVQLADENIVSAALAVSGVGERPVRLHSVEGALDGARADVATFAEVAPMAADDDDQLRPPDDVHATGAYRRKVLPALVEQALTTAARRAAGAGEEIGR
jgi:aerobic carbon-monoxide dehydrogenase medium subunit